MHEMSEEEYLYARDNYVGVCRSCGEETEGGVEPDARGYKCEYCEKNAVYGIEEALMMGYVSINE